MLLCFTDTEKFKRTTDFPINISRLYSCPRRRFPQGEQEVVFDKYEITIRLDSDAPLCRDVIDGEEVNLPFPNVVFKSPGMRIRLVDDTPREAIGFNYSPRVYALLRQWNMLPECKFMPFKMTPELQELFNRFRKFSIAYPTLDSPGDVIDGICFDILRELRLSSWASAVVNHAPEIRIREAELFMRHHFDKNINFDELAARFDFSHSGFYQHWKKYYNCSPLHYLETLKLRHAAVVLLQSARPAAQVAHEVGFSGITAFYRKFKEYFGATPNEFRRSPELCRKYFPDLKINNPPSGK